MNPPPRGRGLYVRDSEGTFQAALSTCQWVGIQPGGKLATRVGVLRERGIPFWLYTLVGSWTPDRWEDEATRLATLARELEAEGILADPEGGWSGVDAEPLGRRLAAIAQTGLSVGVTSFPLWPGLSSFARGADGKVWGSPQCYYLGTVGREGFGVISRWVDRWKAAGMPVIPSVSAGIWEREGFKAPDTIEAWRAYYGAVPDARAAIGWPISGPTGNVLAAWREYTPSVIPVEGDRLVSAAERFLGLPIEAIAGLLGSLAVLLVVGLWWLGR